MSYQNTLLRLSGFGSGGRTRFFFTLLSALLVVFGPAPVAAEQQSDDQSLLAEGAVPTGPVIIDGRVLFRVRGVTAYPAEKRAQDIAARIAKFAADTNLPVDSLRTIEGEYGTRIVVGNAPLMQVFDADGRIEGIDRHLLARAHTDAIARAVAAYRDDRSRSRLFHDVLATFGISAGLALFLFVLVRSSRALRTALERRYQRRLEQFEAESYRLIRARSIWSATRVVIIVLSGLLAVIAAYLSFDFVLSLYPWTRGFAGQLLDLLLAPVASATTGILSTIPNLVVIAIICVVAYYLLRLARLFFDSVKHGRIKLANFDAEWADPTQRLVRLLITAFAVVISYPYIPGSDSAAFKGVSIFLGVLFSLGSSSYIANLIAGYTMTYRRAFRVGDRISIGGAVGDVTEIRLMVTHLRTPKNEELVIPNSSILTSQVTNFSSFARERGLILHTTVGIGYETPWRQVEAMLLQAAARTAGILHEPPAFVLQKDLGDFAITYELNVYSDHPLEMNRLYTELHHNILDVFNEYGVAIMTPAYVSDPAEPKLVPKEKWFASPAQAEAVPPPAERTSVEPLPRPLLGADTVPLGG